MPPEARRGDGMEKPFSQACENNRQPIAAVLARHLDGVAEVLEIGSGTGQHAVYFAAQFPEIVWRPSDLEANHAGIRAWRDDAGLANLAEPLTLDVFRRPWPVTRADGVFSANTAHILSWAGVEAMLAGIGEILAPGGRCLLYGPFNYGGRYTSESNARFDEFLRRRDPDSGVRDFEAVVDCAGRAGLELIEDCPMPANNRTLVWRRG